MIGAILGDIIGSHYEFTYHKSKEFELLHMSKNFITDDTLMTIAVGNAILKAGHDFEALEVAAHESLLDIGRRYPNGYGSMFKKWLKSDEPKPYNSYGNGAAMRVSACGICYDTLEDVKACSRAVTKITHNHPEGLIAAEVVAVAIFHLRHGMSKYELRKFIQPFYNMYTNLDEIRPKNKFTEDAKYTVPPAVIAFLESYSFEDAIRNAISLGGDADTIAAITGSLAEAYYGIPEDLYKQINDYIFHEELIEYVNVFLEKYPIKVETKIDKNDTLVFIRK